MIEFVYTKDRLPQRDAACIIWQRENINMSETLCMNMSMARFDYTYNVWRYFDSNETVQAEVVKYIEIPGKYFNDIVKRPNPLIRIFQKIRGRDYETLDALFRRKSL